MTESTTTKAQTPNGATTGAMAMQHQAALQPIETLNVPDGQKLTKLQRTRVLTESVDEEVGAISKFLAEHKGRLEYFDAELEMAIEQAVEEVNAIRARIAKELGRQYHPVQLVSEGKEFRDELAEQLKTGKATIHAKDGKLSLEKPAKAAPGVKTGKTPTPTRKPKAMPTGRLARRSQEDIDALVAKVVGLVKKHAETGLRAENIRQELDLQAKELPRVLHRGLELKKLKAKGHKRATSYFATGK